MARSLSEDWDHIAPKWIDWAREPGHDSYWVFHRECFLDLVAEPGRLTLDVGCGEGRVGRDLEARGHNVIGVDHSAMAVEACVAHADGHPAAIGDAARLPFGTAVADLVVGFMSFHDLDDLEGAVREAARVLGVGGRIHLALVHPINSAGAWSAERDGEPQVFVIDGSYLETFRYADHVERDGLEMTFHSCHRPLGDYVRALAAAGFVIESMEEVTDDDSARWSRVPLFLHIIAERR